jgi:hypothetical protein
VICTKNWVWRSVIFHCITHSHHKKMLQTTAGRRSPWVAALPTTYTGWVKSSRDKISNDHCWLTVIDISTILGSFDSPYNSLSNDICFVWFHWQKQQLHGLTNLCSRNEKRWITVSRWMTVDFVVNFRFCILCCQLKLKFWAFKGAIDRPMNRSLR